MRARNTVVLLSGPEDDDDSEADMRFRLYYEGPLRSTQGEPRPGQPNKMAPHKHAIRKEFHKQLKQFWATDKFLSTSKMEWDSKPSMVPQDASAANWGGDEEYGHMAEVIAARYQQNGYRFVPLVREEAHLLCSLRILFLRRDPPGSVLTAGDIDNRLKTLIDALRMPSDGRDLVGNETPADGEDPFFCLLRDDKQVTHLEVETDTLLDPMAEDDADRSKARIIVTVELRPYYVTMNNLSFG